jgi:hypothetical protein
MQRMSLHHIRISLPTDRSRPGALELRDPDGQRLMAAPCLGRGTGHPSLNPQRSPMRRWGHTPLGDYRASAVVDRGADQAGRPPYGRYVFALRPADARVVAARKGLMIHGGRGNDRLVTTRGCVRLLDLDMARLAKALQGNDAVVTIEEAPQIDARFAATLTYLRSLTASERSRLFQLAQ